MMSITREGAEGAALHVMEAAEGAPIMLDGDVATHMQILITSLEIT